MTPNSAPITKRTAADTRAGLVPLALLAIVAGAVAGLVTVVFRLGLIQGERAREALLAWSRGRAVPGFLLVIGATAVAAGLAAWLVRRFSRHAAGSGIPHVEAVVSGEVPPPALSLVPVKFFGGLLAIGAGLALGREGPSVQMGAVLAYLLGRLGRRADADCRTLLAAGAGAGLAAAFNAPLAGTAFVLEEIVRRFDLRLATAALGASTGAIIMVHLLLGPATEFQVASLPVPDPANVLLCVGLGLVAGILGAAYNRALLGTLALTDRFGRWPAEWRAAGIGAAVGALAWFAPGVVGGGDAMTQRLFTSVGGVALLPLLFLMRFALGAVSYAAGTPGGLFAPLLVLGAQLGFLAGALAHHGRPDVHLQAVAFAVVGAAAFFTAVVRAPLTGIILVTEMTGSFTLLLPMLAACFAAMAVANLLGSRPIYDSLKERTLRLQQTRER